MEPGGRYDGRNAVNDLSEPLDEEKNEKGGNKERKRSLKPDAQGDWHYIF